MSSPPLASWAKPHVAATHSSIEESNAKEIVAKDAHDESPVVEDKSKPPMRKSSDGFAAVPALPKKVKKRIIGPARGPPQSEDVASEPASIAQITMTNPDSRSSSSEETSREVSSKDTDAGASGNMGPQTTQRETTQAEDSDGFPSVPYTIPTWAGDMKEEFRLEILKNGTVIDEIPLKGKSKLLVGRLPNCDIVMEHQSVSRYHAVIQCGDDGHVYVYDLSSTHGTKINKSSVQGRKYFRLRVGHMVRFGASSRLYILTGSEETIMSEQQRLEEVESKVRDKMMAEEEARKEKEARGASGISWGMDDDDTDGPGEPGIKLGEDVVMHAEGEMYYIEDPRKALRTYFEREGEHLDYETEQDGPGHARVYTCRIRLPGVEGEDGEPLVAEASIQGKKREAITEAALMACKMLDAKGVLRGDDVKATRKAKRKARKKDDDDDDDTFYDRTGEVEAKRKRKEMRKAALVTETFESLSEKKANAISEIKNIQEKLSNARKKVKEIEENSELDPLDAFVSGLTNNLGDETISRMKRRQRELQIELNELDKLLTLVTPSVKI